MHPNSLTHPLTHSHSRFGFGASCNNDGVFFHQTKTKLNKKRFDFMGCGETVYASTIKPKCIGSGCRDSNYLVAVYEPTTLIFTTCYSSTRFCPFVGEWVGRGVDGCKLSAVQLLMMGEDWFVKLGKSKIPIRVLLSTHSVHLLCIDRGFPFFVFSNPSPLHVFFCALFMCLHLSPFYLFVSPFLFLPGLSRS